MKTELKAWWDRNWVAMAILLTIVAVSLAVSLKAQDVKGLDLTELEKTKLQLLQEKQKNQTTRASMIMQAYQQNQQEGQALKAQAQDLSNAICQAHGLKADTCTIAADNSRVVAKIDPPKKK